MTIKELKALLRDNPGKSIQMSMLVNRLSVPAHFHVTEVGHVLKNFVDCGGTIRRHESCLIQVWVADDKEHRIDTTKLLGIISKASDFISDDLPVEVEYGDVATQYRLGEAQTTKTMVLFYLEPRHTQCLAPEKCGPMGCRVG